MRIKRLKAHCDERGRLVELFKGTWGQVTLVEVAPGTSRGGHRHPNTNERWVVISGRGFLRLEDDGGETLLEVLGTTPQIVDVPAGCGHEITNLGDEPLVLIYWADKQYDPTNPDEEVWNR